MITTNEAKALKAIIDSEYQDGSNPVDHSVWTMYVNPFPNKITQAGVYNSLIKKGLIWSTPAVGGEMGTVAITQKGLDALNASKGTIGKGDLDKPKAAVKPKAVVEGIRERGDRANLDFFKPVDHGNIQKLGKIFSAQMQTKRIERGIRLYCTQYNSTWNLQVRGPLALRDGRDGVDDIVAGAQLDREAMIALRDAINTLLGSK